MPLTLKQTSTNPVMMCVLRNIETPRKTDDSTHKTQKPVHRHTNENILCDEEKSAVSSLSVCI